MRAPETEGKADYRGVAVCAVLAVVAVVVGVGAVVADEAVLGLAAAVVGVAAAGVGALVDVRRTRAEDSLWEARAQTRRLRRQLDSLQAAVAEEQQLATGRVGASLGGPSLAELPEGTETGEWEIDPVSGLLRERHLPVLLQQVVAAARRKVLPVAVVFWELDGLAAAPAETCDQALTALGAVAWRTLRESDAVFRLGDVVAVAVLVDTAEPGAVIVAERVRDALRSSPVGDSLTVSAGIACYPTHALDAAELVARAGQALEVAREHGHERDHVAVAATDPSD
jgi:diguanylate cyclase (GGDEF)-like protein